MMNKKLLRLGVNIDHVATLRQARGTHYPDILAAARCCEDAGADGITVHLREDRRHIQDSDVYALRESLRVPLNLEMANHPDIVRVALDVRPDEVCLVPEKREELTTEGGLDAAGCEAELGETVKALGDAGIAVSLFIDPDEQQVATAARLKVPYVELHTGTCCDAWGASADAEAERLVRGAAWAHAAGIRVNAGHGINCDNIGRILAIPYMDTLNIGHSIVARALFIGLAGAVAEMQQAMAAYTGGRCD